MEKNTIKKIIIVNVCILLVAVLGTIFVNLGMDWFNLLNKPFQWIPNIVIPIVWTIIYLTFAIILSIWLNKSKLPKIISGLLIINGAFNVLWCFIFFTLKLTFLGNIIIIINLILAYYLILEIKKHNLIFFYITSIYPIWISLATTLNTALWILN